MVIRGFHLNPYDQAESIFSYAIKKSISRYRLLKCSLFVVVRFLEKHYNEKKKTNINRCDAPDNHSLITLTEDFYSINYMRFKP